MENKHKIYYLPILFLFVLSYVFVFSYADAARLFFETEVTEVGVGQRMEIALYIDAQGEVINAVEGKVAIGPLMLVESIRDGNSLVALWTERPTAEDPSEIIFSGIIPGGWGGAKGSIFSFVVETTAQGVAAIDLGTARVLLHDGKGTETELQIETLVLGIDAALPIIDLVSDEEDIEPPEPFTPLVGHQASLFSGDYFLSFVAQDKGSGIDHYEVQETDELLADERLGAWQTITSPYRIQDQTLGSYVYIRAVDRAGNIRVALFHDPTLFEVEPGPPSKKPILPIAAAALILIGFIILVMVLRKKIRNKS